VTILAQPDRYGAVGVTVLLCVSLCLAARRRPGPWTRVVARSLAVLLVANLVIWEIVTVVGGAWSPTNGLLLDLCPVVSVIGAAALWRPRPLLVELTYFWGCAGSIQGVFQPDRRYDFPNYFYFEFYGDHSGPVLAGLFLVLGLGLAPRRHAVPRVFALTVALACVAALADLLTGGNYLFRRDKGPRGTLLDVLGPWPWYIASAAVVALMLLLVLDAPFRVARVRHRRR